MRVKQVIKERGFTQEQVAAKLGITRVTLIQNINGNPSLSTLRRIADAIGCKVGDFFTDEMTTHSTNFVCPNCGTPLEIVIRKKL